MNKIPKYTKKQKEAERKMSDAFTKMSAAYEILTHFENKFGKMHSATTEIRLLINDYQKKAEKHLTHLKIVEEQMCVLQGWIIKN